MKRLPFALACLMPLAAHAELAPLAPDPMACAAPYRTQVVRALDFGRLVVAADAPGSVTVSPDGAALALGGVNLGSPPAAAEIVFCGTPGERFEVRFTLDESPASGARIAPGSLEAAARGAMLERRATGVWEGELQSTRVVLMVGGRLDVPGGGRLPAVNVAVGVELRRVD